MKVKRTLLIAVPLAACTVSAAAQVTLPPINISGQFEYSISDRQGLTEQGDNEHRQRSHPGVLLAFGSVLPLDNSGLSAELFVSTKLTTGDATPAWSNSFGNREAWGGINSQYGSVRFGRQWLDSYINVLDPYASGGNIGEMSELGTGAGKGYPAGLTRISNAIWADNSLTYTSPKVAGLATLRAQFYWNGSSFTDEKLVSATAPNIAPNTKAANGYILGARIDYPAVRIDLNYGSQKQNLKNALATSDNSPLADGVYETTQIMVGGMLPLGPHSVRALLVQDKTQRPNGSSIKDNEIILGGQYSVTPNFHLRPVFMIHKVDTVPNDANDYKQLRVELAYKMNIGLARGSTSFWFRPTYRKWDTSGNKFTELRAGFTTNF